MPQKDEKYTAALDYFRKLCSTREYAPKDIREKALKRLSVIAEAAGATPWSAADKSSDSAGATPEACSKASVTTAGATPEALANQIIQTLIDEGFLSAQRFATAFARDKASIAGWGPVKIKFMLRAKGIDDDIIAAALTEIDNDKAEEKLLKALSVKKKSLDSDPQVKLKLLKFALSRGYDYDLASKVVAKVLQK